jgi:hypothetical protein
MWPGLLESVYEAGRLQGIGVTTPWSFGPALRRLTPHPPKTFRPSALPVIPQDR